MRCKPINLCDFILFSINNFLLFYISVLIVLEHFLIHFLWTIWELQYFLHRIHFLLVSYTSASEMTNVHERIIYIHPSFLHFYSMDIGMKACSSHQSFSNGGNRIWNTCVHTFLLFHSALAHLSKQSQHIVRCSEKKASPLVFHFVACYSYWNIILLIFFLTSKKKY